MITSVMNPYEVLGLKEGASFNEVRCSYKKLAKQYHPDRLHNIDEAEKTKAEEYFKKVTVAYHVLLEKTEKEERDCGKPPSYNWASLKSVLLNTFVDVATKYMQRQEHYLRVPVTMEEFYTKKKKRLQLFLKNVDQPIVIDIVCNKKHIRTDVLAENNDVHDIHLELFVKEHPIFDVLEDGSVVANVSLSWAEYLQGKLIDLKFLDGSDIKIVIPPLLPVASPILHESGKFYVCIDIIYPSHEWWSSKTKEEQNAILNILDTERTLNPEQTSVNP